MELDERWIYAQQSVLGSVLISPECAGKLVFGVSAEDFVAQYRTIYEAIRELYTTGKAVDPTIVVDTIGESKGYKTLISDNRDCNCTWSISRERFQVLKKRRNDREQY